MSFFGVELAIRNRLGLDPAALGPSILQRTIESRMRATSVSSVERYLELLSATPEELKALASELVVSETWFFRGGFSLFQRLAQLMAERAEERSVPVRVLSLPCSTGEEPYSMAIALQENGLSPRLYHIVAIDLSPSHIERAIAARYSNFAFREPGNDIRPTYFKSSGNSWIPIPQIRDAVQFRTGNIIDPSFLAGEPLFDLVICRNLFIYLTVDGRKRAIESLDRILAKDGYFCVTPAEANRLSPHGNVAEGPIEFGLYRRTTSASLALSLEPSSQSTPTKVNNPTRLETILHRAELPTPKMPEPETNLGLENARALADGGQLKEARVACEELIRAQKELPGAYSLLGVLHQAEGRLSEAAESFRRALYLEPNHLEALTHAIVLCETRGDATQAVAFRKRLQRLSGEGTP